MSQYSSSRSPGGPRRPASGSHGRLINDPLAQQLPLVSGRWLLWSLLGVFGGGLLLVYLTVCLLFWQGQWQILFHPASVAPPGPAIDALPVENVRFGADESGRTRLHGWFLKRAPGAAHTSLTILYLHAMTRGSLADAVPELTLLHALGSDVFAFDYQGFGESRPARPSEERASSDTEAAWQYLTETRHVPPGSIVLIGEGLAASLAADAAARHLEAAGLVLEAPSPTALEIFRADSRSHWIPLRLLARDRFDPRQPLAAARQPKLFLLTAASEASGMRDAAASADPKAVVRLPAGPQTEQEKMTALRRFLDGLHAAIPAGPSPS